ncbi:UBX domain-containing protein 11 isoform X2 [Manis pentadactyla]|uniref:UBX domain-containing protein 11 isoform X2 n=2 Tax=Manis pentadactyla TaxID=143292 RepID=UPI00255C44EC|nr:UBX domain-containing protein 11 isoform X2 [Manis pentadactyla]
MSSPLASLGKARRVPLQSEPVNSGLGWGPGTQGLSLDDMPGVPNLSVFLLLLAWIPRRQGVKIYRDEDEVDVLNDGHGLEEKISVPSCYGGICASVSRQVPVFHDSELVATMTRKMRDLEQQVKAQTDELLSKDRKIRALEELVQTLQKHRGEVTQQRQQELETMCTKLRRQVEQMERFLGDYGLLWVGEPVDEEDGDGSGPEDSTRDRMTAKKFWKPGDSLVPPEVDFDRLLASLKDLSELVVDSDTQVTPVPSVLEPIPLKLYQNGIMMFDGPFRPFHDPSTQRCLRDILDGFFPSELQWLYPDGVPFKISDLRNQVYLENGLDLFPGKGRVVGRQICKPLDKMEHGGSRMTAKKFLNRLPKCVIQQGEVIDIRRPIWDTLQSCCPWSARIQEIMVETPALAAERERNQESPESPAPQLSMLRIKSENGEQVFLLMMRPEDTVGDMRTLLAQARAMDATTFEIFSTFPPTVYQNDALTLQAAGLVPNATLLLRSRMVPLPAPGSLSK